jgi:N-acetyl-alpha-D-muramate 1-phosphate uridylyltransferase
MVRAIILAAGRGERMRPLTDTTPKPMLKVHGKPLMQWPLEALARGGCADVVINTAWLGETISKHFGPALGDVRLHYSHEGHDFGGALETAGGIARALPLLCPSPADDVFWVAAGDVFAPGFVFDPAAAARFAASGKLAHLWLVPNPPHNPRGDFGLGPDPHNPQAPQLALNLPPEDPQPRYTYSTIGLYHRALFALPWCGIAPGNPQGTKAALAPLLRAAMAQQRVSAELFTGSWTDVGTPERLAQLNAEQAIG